MKDKPIIPKAQKGGEYKKFFNDYLNSPNYKKRLDKQGYSNTNKVIKDRKDSVNKIDLVYNDYADSQYFGDNGIININKPELKKYNMPQTSTEAHEFGHAAGSLMPGDYLKNKNLGLSQKEELEIRKRNLYNNINTGYDSKLSMDEKLRIDHDSRSSEAKSNIDALRFKLKKDGIYDTGTQEFNQSHLNKAKEKYKKDGVINRNFKGFKDKDLIYLMNNIADSDIIKDDNGQWRHPGEITQINSNNITMQGVDYPVLGISDTGDKQLMQPGQDYKFNGNKVTEIPISKNGGIMKRLTKIEKAPDGTVMSWGDLPPGLSFIDPILKGGPKKDVRKKGDVLKIQSSVNDWDVNKVRTTKSLKGLGKRNTPIEQSASDDFVNWFSDPKTREKFEQNTGLSADRLQDFIGKGLRTPIRKASSPSDYSTLYDSNADATWSSPGLLSLTANPNKKTGEILYDTHEGDLNYTPNKLKSIVGHEIAHASSIDEVLGKPLKDILGETTSQKNKSFKKGAEYLNTPNEQYGNFHMFRQNLGLQPGEQVDEKQLKKLVKDKKLEGENFYKAFDDDKIVKAINTIAKTDDAPTETATAARGARMPMISYGQFYNEAAANVMGSGQPQQGSPEAEAPSEGKSGKGIGETINTVGKAYQIYKGFGGSTDMLKSFGGSGASSVGSSVGGSAGSYSGMISSIGSFFGKNGAAIPKYDSGGPVQDFSQYDQYMPNNNPGNDYYSMNNPYFSTNPGPIQPKQAPGGDVAPTGPQQVSNVAPIQQRAQTDTSAYTALPASENKLAGWSKTAKKIDFLGISGSVLKAIGGIKQEKEEKKRAYQARNLSQLNLKAAISTDVDARRMAEDSRTNQRDAQMPVNTGEEFFPVYGSNNAGALAENGIHIKPENVGKFTAYKKRTGNTTEEALHSEDPHVRQMANFARNASKWNHAENGTTIKAFAGAAVSGGAAGGAGGGAVSGGATPWGMIGAAGSGIAGQATGNNAGGALGGTIGGTIGSIWGPAGRAVGQILGTTVGGLIDTNPKKTKKAYGEVNRNIQEIATADAARGIQGQYASYVEYGGEFPSYAEGGNLPMQTGNGGELETLSVNPYLPNSGETAMFNGNSHEEGGIMASYGGNKIEAEGGEPVVELPDEEGVNAVIFGNLKISKNMAHLIGDDKASNKKFKNYIADLSKQENKHMKMFNDSMEEYSDFTPITSFDKLKANTMQIKMQGSDMALKDIAEKKQKAAEAQRFINETADEYGLDADSLAKGNYKKGKPSDMAAKGKRLTKPEIQREDDSILANADRSTGNYNITPEQNYAIIDDVTPETGYSLSYTADQPEAHKDINYKPYIDTFNQLLPYMRNSNDEDLSMDQLQGEMYALGNNSVDPVYARGYTPLLDQEYNVSLQDSRNEVNADFRAAQRIAGYNQAAQANLAAQKYGADQKISAEEFRINQTNKAQTRASNTAKMNDAQLKNLGIFDQQYVRQSQAKSNTKAITQAALSSISDKILKNRSEQRKLQLYENLYNYRFDGKGRAINENPIAQFDTQLGDPGVEGMSEVEKMAVMKDQLDEYEAQQKAARKAARSNAMKRNGGSIVKSYKTM